MIDFQNATFFKLKKVTNEKSELLVGPLLVSDESIISTYKGLRDQVVFTSYKVMFYHKNCILTIPLLLVITFYNCLN